ncbi:MAG: DUF3293 domain-containing protein [Verrucomicrobiales bacterium]|nr:DUF3293 domain-containing protein [Verrucomicrobiales bacterium]
MKYFYLKIGKGNWLAEDWLAGRNPLGVPAAALFFDNHTLQEYEAGAGKKQPRRFVERGKAENREQTRMVVISKGTFYLLKPAGEVKFVSGDEIGEYYGFTVKAMPVEVLKRCSVSEIPLVLAEVASNRYYGSGTFREIKDVGNLMAIDWVEGRVPGRDEPARADHWKLFRMRSGRPLKCLGNVGLETLVAKSMEAAGCFVPAYRGGQVNAVDIFAHNDGDETIQCGPISVAAGEKVAIQVKRKWTGRGCPDGADYLVAIGESDQESRVVGSEELFDLAMNNHAVKQWFLRSLDWLPPKVFYYPFYRRTWFRLERAIPLSSFAIMTPDNPDGEVVSPETNEKRCREFEEDLQSRGVSAIRLEAGSKDFTHRESSYAIDVSLLEAIELGRDFQQVAIFWIESGELLLVDCETTEQERVALWADRCVGS